MRSTRISLRSGLTAAAVAAPLALAGPAAALPANINVTATGTLVQVTTTDCPNGGRASLMGATNASFAAGEQVDLTTSGDTQSASWRGVSPGTYTVAVVCADGQSAGSQRVTVSSTAPSPTATASPTAPSGQVRGGLGGGAGGSNTGQIVAGSALAVTVGLGGAWLIRRRRAQRGAD